MIHPDTRLDFINETVGLGVVATRAIPVGTITWVLDPFDQVFPSTRRSQLSDSMLATLHRYSYRLPDGDHLLCWDHGRFLNHSCVPNCLSSGWNFEIAVRPIAAGDQLTNDYGALNLEEALDCECGHVDCRGRIEPDDFDRFPATWDEQVRRVFPQVTRVAQPLWDLIGNPAEVTDAAARPASIPSVSAHRLVEVRSPPPGFRRRRVRCP